MCKYNHLWYLRKIVFGQTKLNENNFTNRMWWALIEEIAPRAENRDRWLHGEKEIACCVRGYHVYKDIRAASIREVLVCSTEPTNVGKILRCKIHSCKIFSYVFYVRKYFYNENKANYGIRFCSTAEIL